MVYQVPASAGHLKKNRFDFRLGEETLSLPKIDFIPPDADDYLVEASGKSLPRKEFILGFIEATDPEVGKKVREARLHRDQVDALYNEWTAASNLDAEKSSASERS